MDTEQMQPELGAGPQIERERPPLDQTPIHEDGPSELERHKEARGYVKPASEPVADPDPGDVTPEPEPEPEPKKAERWQDPDTGDTYDMRHKVARRIKKVLEDRAKANEELAKIRQERDELMRSLVERQQPDPTPAQAKAVPGASDPEPDPTDTERYPEGQYDRAFIRDQAKWAAREMVRSEFETARQARETRARQEAEMQAVSQWQQTVPQAKQKYADFEEVLGRIPNTPENAPIVRLMMGSPVGNDVVYVLGTNPEAMEAYRKAPSNDHRLRLLYHLEAQLLNAQKAARPAEPTTTRAPLPTSPVHAGAGPSGPIDWSRTDDPDQYARWKAARKRA